MKQDSERIKTIAMKFDNAIESRDIDAMAEAFSEDCMIELLGVSLSGKDGARRWARWLIDSLPDVKLTPVVIMVEDGVFFEEFIVTGTLPNGKVVKSKQSEVLVYKDYKIKSLRLYFDRLDFADLVIRDFISRRIVNMIKSRSLKGLV